MLLQICRYIYKFSKNPVENRRSAGNFQIKTSIKPNKHHHGQLSFLQAPDGRLTPTLPKILAPDDPFDEAQLLHQRKSPEIGLGHAHGEGGLFAVVDGHAHDQEQPAAEPDEADRPAVIVVADDDASLHSYTLDGTKMFVIDGHLADCVVVAYRAHRRVA